MQIGKQVVAPEVPPALCPTDPLGCPRAYGMIHPLDMASSVDRLRAGCADPVRYQVSAHAGALQRSCEQRDMDATVTVTGVVSPAVRNGRSTRAVLVS